MPCQVKICGLSEETTLRAAIDAGATMVGFVHFPKSPRHVSLERAAELKGILPSHVKSVIVTVNPDDALVDNILRIVNPDYIQLHGDETSARVAEIRNKSKVIKAIPVATSDDLIYMDCDILMFDSKPSSCGPQRGSAGSMDSAQSLRSSQNDKILLPGGNGIAFDWTILKDFRTLRPWILSGGLTPDNVAEAIRQSGAKYVDVSSGVESKPGVKDAGKIRDFIRGANTTAR